MKGVKLLGFQEQEYTSQDDTRNSENYRKQIKSKKVGVMSERQKKI